MLQVRGTCSPACEQLGCARLWLLKLKLLGQCQRTACVPLGFSGGLLGLSTAAVEFRAARKVRHWIYLHPALCPQLPCCPLIWDSPFSSATPNSPP